MKTLVLVGGGHAHLHCLEQINNDSQKDWRVKLISPSPYQYYSGMFSGFTEGVYSLDDIRIDLSKLCQNIDVEFIEDTITVVDAKSQKLSGENGAVYPYDIVSFDIGSQTAIPESIKNHALSIKPNYRFPDQLLKARESTYPVIVGGGASGVELAFSILSWRKQNQLPNNVALFSSTQLLISQGSAASKKIETIAAQKALPFYSGTGIESVDENNVTTSTGDSHPQTEVLWLTGPKSFELFQTSGLPTDTNGYLLVNEMLQNNQYPEIFGAGDCVTIDQYPALAKNGVYAVRQGPILWENLKKSLSKGQLVRFTPQKRYISILSTGDGEAFLSYGSQLLHGKIPWKIKQYIDRKFMKRYKDLYE